MCGSLYLGHFYVILFLRIVSKWQGTFQTWRHGRRAERGIPLLRPGCLSRVKGHSGQGMAEQEKITRKKMAGMGEICSCYFFLPKTEDMCYN